VFVFLNFDVGISLIPNPTQGGENKRIWGRGLKKKLEKLIPSFSPYVKTNLKGRKRP
jgi:hypothetical protein